MWKMNLSLLVRCSYKRIMMLSLGVLNNSSSFLCPPLPPSTPQRKASTGATGSFGSVSLESLLKCIQELDMDDTQRRRMEIFLNQKQKVSAGPFMYTVLPSLPFFFFSLFFLSCHYASFIFQFLAIAYAPSYTFNFCNYGSV